MSRTHVCVQCPSSCDLFGIYGVHEGGFWTLTAQYAKRGLRNGRAIVCRSVCLSVCLINRQEQRCAAGLLLSAPKLAGDGAQQ